jgi:hypothetical protein
MYQIKVCDFMNSIKYLTYQTYSGALNAYTSFSSLVESEYSPQDYIDCSHSCTSEPIENAKLFNTNPVKLEYILYTTK